MKKLILISFLFAIAITGCKKCVTCETLNNADGVVFKTTQEVCGTSKEIKEKEGTVTTVRNDGAVITTTTSCK